METFHLLHLANSWPRPDNEPSKEGDAAPVPPTGMPASSLIFPSSTLPTSDAMITTAEVTNDPEEDLDAEETILYPVSTKQSSRMNSNHATPPTDTNPLPSLPTSKRRIRAAAVQMIFAERTSRAFISPEEVETLQEGAAKGLLETLFKWHEQRSTELVDAVNGVKE